MSFLHRLSESLRRRSVFDYRFPALKPLGPGWMKDGFMAVYERLNVLRDPDFNPRHEHLAPRAALN